MAADEKPEPWDATKNIDDRLLLKQKKIRPYVDFILKCFVGVLLFGINLGIDVLNRSLFLLLFGDHRSLLNLNDIRGDNNETNCSIPVKEEIYENLLYVVRPYRIFMLTVPIILTIMGGLYRTFFRLKTPTFDRAMVIHSAYELFAGAILSFFVLKVAPHMPYLALIAICYSDNLITGVYQTLRLIKVESGRLTYHRNSVFSDEVLNSRIIDRRTNKIELFFVSIAFLLQAGSVSFAGILGIEYLEKINVDDWMIDARGLMLLIFLVFSSGRHWMTYLPEVSKTAFDASNQRDAMAGIDVCSGIFKAIGILIPALTFLYMPEEKIDPVIIDTRLCEVFTLFFGYMIALYIVTVYIQRNLLGLACQIRLQFLCFSLPSLLGPLITFAIWYKLDFGVGLEVLEIESFISAENTTISTCEFQILTSTDNFQMAELPSTFVPNLPEELTSLTTILSGINIDLATLLWIIIVSGFVSNIILVRHVFTNLNSKPYARIRDQFVHTSFELFNMPVQEMSNRRVKEYDTIEKRSVSDISGHPPYIFICVPLWHEEEVEMETMTRSLYRMIEHQKIKSKTDSSCYELEVHIFFDAPFEKKNLMKNRSEVYDRDIIEWKVTNEWVNSFINVLRRIVEGNGEGDCWKYGQVFPTPYGGKIVYDILGTEFTIHLKDPDNVKRGKRWSQIMYLYYLCGWKMDQCQMTNSKGVKLKKENTYILALDGDVDFFPNDFELVLARMVASPDVGACCNQIHPNGSGPMVWFQRFEYAVGHWFQKAAEHILGCVLCSPGCFSLLRVSNLMKDNVMATYKGLATDAMTKLMYDQGEDRWLCTLILLSGGRIEFEAGSHCQTFAPEDPDTFFKQRRRWGPSTFVNIFELISNKNIATKMNPYLTSAYIFYHMLSMTLSTIGVTTTLFVIWEGLELGLGSAITTEQAWALVFLPVLLYALICWRASGKKQLLWAKILSVLYSIIMVLLIVTVAIGVNECSWNLTGLFIMFLSGIHLLAALLHWDFKTAICGIIYWVGIPLNFIFLQIYMIANINDVSWGTRSASTGPKKEKMSFKDKLRALGKKRWPGMKFFWDYLVKGAPEGMTTADIPRTPPQVSSSSELESEMDKKMASIVSARKSTVDWVTGNLIALDDDDKFISPFTILGGKTIAEARSRSGVTRSASFQNQVYSVMQSNLMSRRKINHNMRMAQDLQKFETLAESPIQGDPEKIIEALREEAKTTIQLNDSTRPLLVMRPFEGEQDVRKDGTELETKTLVYRWVNNEMEERFIEYCESDKFGAYELPRISAIRQREYNSYKKYRKFKETQGIWEDGKFVPRPEEAEPRGKSSYLDWVLNLRSPLSDRMKIYSLPEAEHVFWAQMTAPKTGYLRVPSPSEEKETRIKNEEMAQQLTDFRNKVAGAMIFINILFFVFALVMKLQSDFLPKVELTLPVVAVTWGKEESGCDWINSQVPQQLGPKFQLTPDDCELDETALNLTSIIIDAQDRIKEEEGFENFAFQCADYIASLNGWNEIELSLPIFQLFFLVLYIILMSMQVLCMLIHRWSTLMHYIANISYEGFRLELHRINDTNKQMTYIRENGVHKDDKDKQWSASLRDFALDVMKLTFAINSAAAAEGNRRDDKWIDLYRRTTVRARALNPTLPTEKERFRFSTRGIPNRLASKFGDFSRSVRSSMRKPWSRKVSVKDRTLSDNSDTIRATHRTTHFQINDEIIV